ncbi:CocE/NonD family hydrolase [Streptomyces sp. NPDC001970]
MVQPVTGFPGVTLESDVRCRLRDGVELLADVYRPDAAGGPYPVLLQRTPYGKQGAQSETAFAHPAWYAHQGFIVVVQDVRGRYASGGEFYPFRDEGRDGHDAVEWAAGLPGSNGRVGMYGFSYAGFTQLLAAVEQPPSLAAISPALTGSQAYEGWTHNKGAFAYGFNAFWAAYLGIAEAVRRGDQERIGALSGALMHAPDNFWMDPETFPALDRDITPYYFDWIEHPTYDDYWARWSIDSDYSRIQVPGLHVAGLYDVFVSGTKRNFVGLRNGAGSPEAAARQKFVVAPFHHMPWYPVAQVEDGVADSKAVDDCQVRFFTETLKETGTGTFESAVSTYVLGAGWRDFSAWPPQEARMERLFLHSQGRANTRFGDGTLDARTPGEELPDLYIYDPNAPVMSAGGHSCCVEELTPMGPACQCQRENVKGVLVYTTAPQERDVDVVGDVTLTLYAASSATDTDWTARLCLVDEDGCSRNLQEGIVRAAFRESLTTPQPITPGEVYKYVIDLGPVSARVPAGARLRIDVTSSDFPQWARNSNSSYPGDGVPQVATQTVLHTAEYPSHLTLPMLPA